MRAQLKRATDKYGPMNSNMLSRAMSQPALKDLDLIQSSRVIGTLHIQNIGNVDHEVYAAFNPIPKPVALKRRNLDHIVKAPSNSSTSSEVCSSDAGRNFLSASDQSDSPG